MKQLLVLVLLALPFGTARANGYDENEKAWSKYVNQMLTFPGANERARSSPGEITYDIPCPNDIEMSLTTDYDKHGWYKRSICFYKKTTVKQKCVTYLPDGSITEGEWK